MTFEDRMEHLESIAVAHNDIRHFIGVHRRLIKGNNPSHPNQTLPIASLHERFTHETHFGVSVCGRRRVRRRI